MMIDGGKSKYTCLLTLIKHESPTLYNLVCDLCLDGTFRSQRYQNTFLMPNAKLVAHFTELVDKDEDIRAINEIRSLVLKGHVKKAGFKKDAKIGTLQYGSYVLAEPEKVGENVAASKSTVIATREGGFATLVLMYQSDVAPKTVEGRASIAAAPVSKSGGAVSDGNLETVKHVTKSLIVENDHVATLANFTKAVAAALNMLESESPERYARAKYYLSANPILSWFFLVSPGRQHSLVPGSDLVDFAWAAVTNAQETITAAETSDYEPDVPMLKAIKAHRNKLRTGGDRASLVNMIKQSYKELLPQALKVKAVDQFLADNLEVKMLMDELRFRYEGDVETWSSVNDSIRDLGGIRWGSPSKFMVINDEALYSKYMKNAESFMSGPVSFVNSVYFCYIPLSKDLEQKLEKGMQGGAVGGNPGTAGSVYFAGGAARKQAKQVPDLKLASLVKVLSKSQREMIKQML